MAAMKRRKPTTCEACGYKSYAGRVCQPCKRFWGGSAENVLAAVALRTKLERCFTLEEINQVLFELVDFVVPFPMLDMHPLVHSVSGQDRGR